MSVEVPKFDEDSQDEDDKTQGKDSRNGSRYVNKTDNERREEMAGTQFARPANQLVVAPETDELVIDSNALSSNVTNLPKKEIEVPDNHPADVQKTEEVVIEGFSKEHQIPREDHLVDIQNVHEDEVDLGF